MENTYLQLVRMTWKQWIGYGKKNPSCASLLKTYCTFQTPMMLCTHLCFVSYSSPEAAVHSQGNVSGGAERLNIEVRHVLRLDVRLPPIGALCSLEPL